MHRMRPAGFESAVVNLCDSFTGIFVMFDVVEVLRKLAICRPLFHSEADFQHSFAWQLQRMHPKATIRLEMPMKSTSGLVHLDILFRSGPTTIRIELKYKTKKFKTTIQDEDYSLRDHSAQDSGRYDFIKDIHRIELICREFPATFGYAIILTNDSSYWRSQAKSSSSDAEFRLYEGRVLSGELKWGTGASAGTIRNRESPISLEGTYKLDWREYSSLTGEDSTKLRFLVIPVH